MAIVPLTDFVARMRAERGPQAKIPDFDPSDGGAEAQVLLVMEAPGPKAIQTGFVSCDNPDGTAGNLKRFLQEAGLARRECVLWNIVPWHVSDGLMNVNPTSTDVQEGLPYLRRLLPLLPRRRAVVLVGRKTQSVAGQLPLSASVRVFRCSHPSPQHVNRHPENAGVIVAALREVAEYLQER